MSRKQSPGDGIPNADLGELADSENSVSRDPRVSQPAESTPPVDHDDPSADTGDVRSRHHNGPADHSRAEPTPASLNEPNSAEREFSAHVVLYQPEIPQNTGNVGRTCVAVGAKLWIVRPAGFRIDDNRIRRAGLDYWQHLAVGDAMNWEDLLDQLAPKRLFFLSKFAQRNLWDADFAPGDTFVFGRESSGLPETILDPKDPRALRIPMSPQVRSLNLATSVGVVLYEQQRQMAASS